MNFSRNAMSVCLSFSLLAACSGGNGSSSSTSSSGGTSSSSSSGGAGSSSSRAGGNSSSASSTSGPVAQENESCVDVDGNILDCVEGTTCINVTDADDVPVYGACKKTCTMDAECAPRTCAIGFIDATTGICGNLKAPGATGCQFWEAGDAFCFNPAFQETDTSAYLECLNGTCGYVCNDADNTGAAYTCPPTLTCGTALATYEGYETQLAVCGAATSGTSSSAAGASSTGTASSTTTASSAGASSMGNASSAAPSSSM